MNSRAINSIATVCGCSYYIFLGQWEKTNCRQTYCESANSEHKMRWKSFISEIICPRTTAMAARAEWKRKWKWLWRKGQQASWPKQTDSQGIYIYILLKPHSAAKCVGKFLAARELFEEKISVAISAPRSVLHFSLMAVSVLLWHKNWARRVNILYICVEGRFYGQRFRGVAHPPAVRRMRCII